ncbi:MAG: helicase-exonuclease AddAB subunit AddA, partial [Lachnospiraceae bacterium]|nr:helicase-exonuclease AddAB subunit AddA [Lachnospiraceae bacterium]
MSKIRYTEDQQKVIDLHKRNILVSAAAGSGKTAVLVERIIQMVAGENKDARADIDRLLVVTFTRAAAAEMRERISAAISARIQEDPENEGLQRQQTLLHNAQITTIDSFCQYILKNHFEAIGLDPAFRVLEEGERKLLMEQAMEELLEKQYEKADPAFLNLVECYGSGVRKGLAAQISKVSSFALSAPWPLKWLEEHKADYRLSSAEELEQAPWMKLFETYVRTLLQDIADLYTQGIRICEEPDGPYKYGETLESDLEQVERAIAAKSYPLLSEKVRAITFARLATMKKEESVDPAKTELVKKLRDENKKALTGLQSEFFTISTEEQLRRMEQVAPAAEAFLTLCMEYLETFSAIKRENNVIDFSDMEHLALDILTKTDADGKVVPSPVAQQLRDYYEEILIDEYQDSNQVQEEILSAISREKVGAPNRFMVGDMKQSIYRFRMARPQLFMEKYSTYTLEDGLYQKILLKKNFRSRKEVLDPVNALFYQMMGMDLGGVEYDKEAALYPGAEYVVPKDKAVEALLVDTGDIAEVFPDRKCSTEEYHRVEARAVALRILKLLKEEQVQEKDGSYRPVSFRDMVILMRSPSEVDEIYQEELASYGIPVYISSNKGYFAASEVQTVLQLLKCVDNPRNDVPLFGTMRSWFGGFSDAELAKVRVEAGEDGGCLYDALQKPEDPKITAFLDFLHTLQQKETYLSVEELLQDIMGETGYIPYVTALPDGEKRAANVRMLLEKAAEFEQTSFHGLNQFVRYMDRLEKYEVDYGEAETLDETADVVRIMSIHKSKGLEFPVCFVSGLGKGLNKQDTSDPILTDMDLGIGMDLLLSGSHLQKMTLRKQMLSRKLAMDSMGEEIRILYVALTRAKEKLILTGYGKDLKERLEGITPLDPLQEEARKRLSFSRRLKASSFLELLLSTSMPRIADLHVTGCRELEEARVSRVILGTGARLKLEGFLEQMGKEKEADTKALLPGADHEKLHLLGQRFAFTYPHKDLENLFIKTSVS